MNRKYISSAISPLLGLLSTLVLSVNIEAQVPRKAQICFRLRPRWEFRNLRDGYQR